MWKSIAAGLLVLTAVTTTAQAQSPEELAARCVHRINQVVTRVENAAAEETQECVRRINALQDAGRYEAAEELAVACIRAATQRARNAADLIDRICNACIDELLTVGEPELARRVNSACDDAIEDVRAILQREKSAIADALAD